ncbi:hypothetical protein V1527DRAFT_461626 [Lipomyces starkeyi]
MDMGTACFCPPSSSVSARQVSDTPPSSFSICSIFLTLGWQSNIWIYPSELLPFKLCLRLGPCLLYHSLRRRLNNTCHDQQLHIQVVHRLCTRHFCHYPAVYFFSPETVQRPSEMVDFLFADRDGKRLEWLSIPQIRSLLQRWGWHCRSGLKGGRKE